MADPREVRTTLSIDDKTGPALDKFNQRIGQADAGMKQFGVSAAQTANGLRQLPAQITDIVTQLSGGQGLGTVFIQQGGQIKDAFGGIAPAVRAVTGYISDSITPLSLMAGGITAVGAAAAYGFIEGGKEAKAFRDTLIGTGNAAGVTTGQLQQMAVRIDGMVGTQAQATEGLNTFIKAGAAGAQNLEYFTSTAIRWEKETGESVEKTAEHFASLKKEPVEAVLKLNETFGFLTVSTLKQIQALKDQGKETEAANLAQKAFADTLAQRAGEMAANAGLVERAWRGIKGVIADAVDAIKDIGRTPGMEQQLATLRQNLERQQQRNASLGIADGKATEDLKNQIAYLQESVRMQQRAAAGKAEELATTQLLGKWQQDGLKFQSKSVQLERELKATKEENRKLEAAGAISAKEAADRIAAVKEHYKEKGPSTAASDNALAKINAEIKGQYEYIAALEAGDEAVQRVTPQHKRYLELLEKLSDKMGEKAKAALLEEIAAAAIADANADYIASEEALIKAKEKFSDQRDKEDQARVASITKIEEEARAVEDQIATFGMNAKALADMTIKRLEDQKATLQGFAGNERAIDLINQEIEARQRLATDKDTFSGLQAEKKAADDGIREREREVEAGRRQWERLGDSLADNLMRGGKSAGDYLKDYFRTLVFRPVVQAVMAPVGQALGYLGNSVLGSGTAGGADGGAASGLGLISAGSSAYNLIGGAGLAGTASSLGFGVSTGFGMTMAGETGAALSLAGANIAGAGGASTAAGLGTGIGALGPYALAALAIYEAFKSGSWSNTNSGYLLGSSGANLGVKNFDISKKTGGGFLTDDKEKTEFFDTPGAQADILSSMYAQSNTALSTALAKVGVNFSDKITGFVDEAVLVGLKGLSVDQQAQVLATYFSQLTEREAQYVLGPGAGGIAKAGETALQALSRISTAITSVNPLLAQLGMTLNDVSVKGAQAASTFLEELGGIEQAPAKLATYRDGYFTQEERNALDATSLTTAFAALGRTLPTSEAQLRSWIEGIDRSTDAGATAAASLINLSGAFKTYTTNVEAAVTTTRQTLVDGVSGAFSSLQRTVDASRTAENTLFARESDRLNGLISSAADRQQTIKALDDSIRSTQSSMATTALLGMSRGEASAQIATAIAIAKASGVLPDADQLRDALQVISQPSAAQARNFVEYMQDFDKQAAQIAELGDLTGEQLSDADRALAVQKDQLRLLQSNHDAEMARLDGVIAAAQAIVDGVNGKGDLIYSELIAIGKLNSAATAAGYKGPALTTTSTSPGTASSQIDALYGSILGRAGEAEGIAYYEGRLAAGESIAQIAASIAASPEAQSRVPHFAAGGFHAGGLAIVGEQGPELAYFAQPAQIYTANQTSQMLAGGGDVSALLRGILARLDAMQREGNLQGVDQAVAFAAMASDIKRVRRYTGIAVGAEPALEVLP